MSANFAVSNVCVTFFLDIDIPPHSWIDACAPEQRNREQVKIESGVIRVQEQHWC